MDKGRTQPGHWNIAKREDGSKGEEKIRGEKSIEEEYSSATNDRAKYYTIKKRISIFNHVAKWEIY